MTEPHERLAGTTPSSLACGHWLVRAQRLQARAEPEANAALAIAMMEAADRHGIDVIADAMVLGDVPTMIEMVPYTLANPTTRRARRWRV